MWYHKILEGNRDNVSKLIKTDPDISDAITDIYRGIGVAKIHVKETFYATNLEEKDFDELTWLTVKNLHHIYKKYPDLR